MPGGQWVQTRSAALVVASPGGRCGLAWGSPRRDGVAGAGRRSGYMGGARLPDRYPAGQVEYFGMSVDGVEKQAWVEEWDKRRIRLYNVSRRLRVCDGGALV